MEEQKNHFGGPQGGSPGGPDGKMCSCGNGACRCGWHGMGHRHSIVRIVIALLVAFFVFWVGVKVGEVKTEFGGYGMGGWGQRGGYYGGSMMYRGYPQQPGYVVPMMGYPAPTSTAR